MMSNPLGMNIMFPSDDLPAKEKKKKGRVLEPRQFGVIWMTSTNPAK